MKDYFFLQTATGSLFRVVFHAVLMAHWWTFS